MGAWNNKFLPSSQLRQAQTTVGTNNRPISHSDARHRGARNPILHLGGAPRCWLEPASQIQIPACDPRKGRLFVGYTAATIGGGGPVNKQHLESTV